MMSIQHQRCERVMNHERSKKEGGICCLTNFMANVLDKTGNNLSLLYVSPSVSRIIRLKQLLKMASKVWYHSDG